jgi:hypothetical protein
MRLYFRNVDGSPAFGGWWMIFVAGFIGVQAILLILRPDLYLRLMVRGNGARWMKRLPERAYRIWGVFGLAVAIGIVVWVFNTTPGKLY